MQTTFLSLKELVANVQNRLSEEEECFVFGGLDHTGHETTDNCQCNGNNCQCRSNNCQCGSESSNNCQCNGNNCQCRYISTDPKLE